MVLSWPHSPASASFTSDAPDSETPLTVRENPQADGFQAFISVDEEFVHLVDEEWLEGVAKSAMNVALDAASAAQMSLLIAGDETVRELNAQYRGLDEITDVLSFSVNHQGHWEGDGQGPEDVSAVAFILPPGEPEPLGEVIVSYPQAMRQADDRAVRLESELAHLIVHGVLHLTGHDHLETEETALMRAKEREALEILGIPEPVRE